VLLEFYEILLEALVWLHYLPLFLCEGSGLAVFHSIFLHEEGNDKGGTSGHTHLAVD